MPEADVGVGHEQAEQVGAEKPLDERLVVLRRANGLGDRADDARAAPLLGERPCECR